MATILVVDDDPSVTASLTVLLERHGHRVVAAVTPEEALAALERTGRQPPALALQDMNFSPDTSGAEGLRLLCAIRKVRPDLPVVLVTAWGSIELAVQGMKAGAADFVTKPWSNDQVIRAVDTALQLSAARRAPPCPSREALDRDADFAGIVGRDPALLRVLDLVARVAPTDASVLVSGESGTGKELLAEALHRNSRRRGGPFVKVNLGGISSTLFESEMFGHVRGAFTDARRDRQGRFGAAEGGTVFLDEIGEVDPSAQVKLLRVLQDRSYEVLGSSTPVRVDARVVAATNRDLRRMVAEGSFREDLLYRLNLIALEMPPLRARRGDVRLLADHFLGRCREAYGRAELDLTERALLWLEDQPWPGNVRELRQVIERAVLVADAGTRSVDVGDLLALAPLGIRPAPEATLPAAGAMTLEEIERAMVVKALAHFDGNVTRVAKALGLSRAALYRRCQKHGIEIKD